MPPRKAPKNASAAGAVAGHDDFSNIPDGVLQHMLSFLPAQDAVRTCVLAKRWRHLWKSSTGLRFVWGRSKEAGTVEILEEIQAFVDHLLCQRIREGTPLDTCEFDLGQMREENMGHIILWIRIALLCKVRELRLSCWVYRPDNCPLDDHPFFISQYLKKLELKSIDSYVMPRRFLDLSNCPVLEELVVYCFLGHALLISSQSLKRLTIGSSFGYASRMRICAPNLVSLWLRVSQGRTPLLERMPSLITAYVKINNKADCNSAEADNDCSNQSIILEGLSEVRNLSLIAANNKMLIFRRDLKFCSSFNNLMSLLLNEYWCEPADFSALACLLKLCPVLEKLTLQLYSEGPEHKVEIKLSCKPLEISGEISRHLKTLEVKCEVYDGRINNVLMFLSKQLNIWFQFGG